MKYFSLIVFSVLILFSLFFPRFLFSQDFREARFYVPPISGIGTLEEETYFYKQVSNEVAAQFSSMVRIKSNSDYTLRGSIVPYGCFHDPSIPCPMHPLGQMHVSNDEIGEFLFCLDLLSSKKNELIGGQYIVYKEIDNTLDEMISVMVYNLLSSIPDFDLTQDRRNRWLFLEPNVSWAPRIYRANEIESNYWANFGFGVSIEFQFVKFMSLGFGFQFTQDWIYVSAERSEEYRDFIMEIPLMLRFIIKFGDNYMLCPYGGMSYNFSLTKITEPCPYSWFAGIQFAVKAGPGFITIDPKFTMDYYDSKLSSEAKSSLEYKRLMLQIGVGYKIGFIQKKNKKDFK